MPLSNILAANDESTWKAPWTDEQVKALEKRQLDSRRHSYTSSTGKDLIPTTDGWREEPEGDVVQKWSWAEIDYL